KFFEAAAKKFFE
nr:Chain A, Synthetic Peptide [synthetic construct]